MKLALLLAFITLMTLTATARAENVTVDNLADLARYAVMDGNTIIMKPGTYALSDYLTDEVLAQHKANYPEGPGRQPRWMFHFSGSHNSIDLTGVTIEIDTTLYARLPYGYTRCLFMSGSHNTLIGLTVTNTGPDIGSNGNIFSIFGDHNTLENVSLYVHGSSPYGYGDLLGKGGPNLVGLKKQSGMMIAGRNNTLRRCRVITRAFGHCFYIQQPRGMTTENILLEDCYAEGIMRSTNDMLRDTEGLAADLDFRSVYQNRDGRFMINPGYMKALCEDGYRTYGGVGNATLRNCIAINTRAGFEIGGTNDAETRTLLDGVTALGCERGFLIGSNVLLRNGRGNLQYGPLLYLRTNTTGADIELEAIASDSAYTVHALATIAGENHRVRLYTRERFRQLPALPIMLGYDMPAHAEMSSPILPSKTANIMLINEIPRVVTIQSDRATDCDVQSPGPVVEDTITQSLSQEARGAWPKSGIAR